MTGESARAQKPPSDGSDDHQWLIINNNPSHREHYRYQIPCYGSLGPYGY